MGNCGVGFAPVRPTQEQWLIELMESVEDIPGAALAEGMDWQWESFPGYLDALERQERAIDVGTQVRTARSGPMSWVTAASRRKRPERTTS